MAKKSTTEKFANVGDVVHLDGRNVVVKNPRSRVLFKYVGAFPRLADKFQKFVSDDDGSVNVLELVGVAAEDDEIWATACDVVSEFCDLSADDIDRLGPSELVKLLLAIYDVVDWEDLSKTFFTLMTRLGMTEETENTSKK